MAASVPGSQENPTPMKLYAGDESVDDVSDIDVEKDI
jgi:hypothetical protein